MKSFGIIQSPDKNSNYLIIVSDTGNVDESLEVNQIIDRKNVIVKNGNCFSKSPVRLWILKQNNQKDCFIELPCMDFDDLGRNIKLGILLADIQTLTSEDIVAVAERFDPALHVSEANIDIALKLYENASRRIYKWICALGIIGSLIILIGLIICNSSK